MATYETKLKEVGRFEAIDADGGPCMVIVQRVMLHRVSLRTRAFAPVDGGLQYRLIDGRQLLRKDSRHFETIDGTVRIHVAEPPDGALQAPPRT